VSFKQDRLTEQIRVILSEVLLRDVADPRLKNVTVTEVKLTSEFEFVDVYVNALGDESRHDEVLKGLERARGFLRRELGKRVRMRSTPDLHFHWDFTLERGERINALIEGLDIPPAEDVEETDFDDEYDFDNEHDGLD